MFSRFTAITGLRIVPEDVGTAARDTLASILGVTLLIVALDAFLFRTHPTQGYIDFFTSPLWPRVWVTSVLAAFDEIKFRLLLMSGLAALFVFFQGKLTKPAAIAIILAAQFANTGHLIVIDPLYGSLRYWLVGCVWGWLYWRHGWLAGLAGHVLTHPLLDPLLLFALSHFAR